MAKIKGLTGSKITFGKKKCGCQRKRKSPKAKNTKVYRGQGR